MDVWPVELFSYIFELACTDDGRTARALSLTSKQVREISRRYLYQSLVLTRPAQLTALLERSENVPCHLRRIKHLFLALRHSDSTTGSLHSESTCPLEAPFVIKVLHLAAPTLESLSFAAACPLTGTSLLSYLFRIPFPFLAELSLAGLYPFSFQSNNFPNLRYLHFAAGNRNPCGLLKFGALDQAFPKLTHLRVSGLSRAGTFMDELECALDQRSRRSRRRPSGEPSEPEFETWSVIQDEIINLPPRLEMIYVQPKASISPAISRPSSRRSSSSRLTKMDSTITDDDIVLRPTIDVLMPADPRQQSMMDRLMRLEEEFGTAIAGSRSGRGDRDVPVHLTVVDACEQQEDVVLGILHDWLVRLDGRDGPWF